MRYTYDHSISSFQFQLWQVSNLTCSKFKHSIFLPLYVTLQNVNKAMGFLASIFGSHFTAIFVSLLGSYLSAHNHSKLKFWLAISSLLIDQVHQTFLDVCCDVQAVRSLWNDPTVVCGVEGLPANRASLMVDVPLLAPGDQVCSRSQFEIPLTTSNVYQSVKALPYHENRFIRPIATHRYVSFKSGTLYQNKWG